jgi:putative ABC transport system permease protein
LPATFLGIDRLDFPQAAFYRDDFADESLGALMNALGAEPMGVLVPRELAEETGFRLGDRLLASMRVLDQNYERDLVIVGTYDYFPTVYPQRRPTLIVNLESVFENPDAVLGYDVWLNTREETDTELLIYQISKMIGIDRAVIKVIGDAYDEVKTSMDLPERVGLFGVLNVGFLITGLMPGIGFVLYSYASLQRRFIQLGILRAIGLSVRQLIGYLVSEQFILMGFAILFGSLIGLVTSYLFVPFLQVGAAPGSPVPPFEVLIGWGEAALLSLAFGIVLFLTILGTIFYLARLEVFKAVKMGESL